jgi:hypothetical protein
MVDKYLRDAGVASEPRTEILALAVKPVNRRD